MFDFLTHWQPWAWIVGAMIVGGVAYTLAHRGVKEE